MTKKRAHNEGSIYKRKDGRWTAQMTIEGKHIVKYFKTQKECREWLQATRNQIDSGLTLLGAQITLAIYMTEWLTTISTSVRPKTLAQYKQIYEQHIFTPLGEIKLKDVRSDQVQALYNAKLKGGTSVRTVIMIHAVLHRAFNHALKMGTIGRNPVDAVTRPKFKRKEMKTLNENQVRTFLRYQRERAKMRLDGAVRKNSKDERCFEALYWIAIATGLRQGELLGLKWSDLNWEKHSLQIQRQLQRIPGGLVFEEPKTASGRRLIILGSELIEKLRIHLQLESDERVKAGHKWQENDLIFPSKNGTPLDPSNLYHHFKTVLKEAGLPNIRFHDLRHTAATLMLLQGTHPKIVQERLGHADISMTLNTYSHVLPTMQDETAEKMDEILTMIDVSDEFKKVGEIQTLYDDKR